MTYALDTTWRVLLNDLGVDPGSALRRAGMPEDLFLQPDVRLAPADFYRLWAGVEAEHGDPLFALRVCQEVRSESFIPPLFAGLCSPNLLVALQRIAKYKKLIGPMQFIVREEPDAVGVEFCWPAAQPQPPVSFVMLELLFCVAVARMGTRAAIRPLELGTTSPPIPAAPYEEYVGAPVTQGPRHLIRFSRLDAERPFLTSNPMLWDAFEPSLRQRLADLQAPAGMVERVRAALHEFIPSGLTTMEAVAAKLALSKRTLQRRIEAEGTSFQAILKETREALARHYLANTSFPTAEISFLLGYDEPNSFYRAFRSWTGTTPDSLRQT